MSIERERRQMLADSEADVAFTRELTGRDHLDESVTAAMYRVRGEELVPDSQRAASFRDGGALPVGYGQTISQPFIVALMTDLLDLRADSIGRATGSGKVLSGGSPGAACQQGLQYRTNSGAGAEGTATP